MNSFVLHASHPSSLSTSGHTETSPALSGIAQGAGSCQHTHAQANAGQSRLFGDESRQRRVGQSDSIRKKRQPLHLASRQISRSRSIGSSGESGGCPVPMATDSCTPAFPEPACNTGRTGTIFPDDATKLRRRQRGAATSRRDGMKSLVKPLSTLFQYGTRALSDDRERKPLVAVRAARAWRG